MQAQLAGSAMHGHAERVARLNVNRFAHPLAQHLGQELF